MKIRRFVCAATVCAFAYAVPSHAQQLFPSELLPGFRGTLHSEYSAWDIFSNPYLGNNFADVAQASSNPSVRQVLTDTAFIPGSGNIYSFAAANGYEVANNVSSTLANPLTNLVFQFGTLGSTIDLSTVRLNYSGGSLTLESANYITESRAIDGGRGGITNRTAVQWDLTGLNITNYTITFQAAGSSNSLDTVTLDTTTNAYSPIVPSSRTWDNGAGDGKWSSAANWSNNTVTTAGGNVTIGSTAGPTIDLDSNREVGELRLTRTGGFSITRSNNAVLTVNSGITVATGASGSYSVAAPIFLGGHGIMSVASGATLELSNSVSGALAVETFPGAGFFFPAAGIYKVGAGTLLLSANNSFDGAVTVNEGTMIVSGVNQYSDVTNITEGSLVLRGNAPNGAAGTLGNAISNVNVGVDPAQSGVHTNEAVLVIDGNFTVGRNIGLPAGDNAKVLAARNTSGAGATYAGNLSMSSTTNNVFLRAEAASDVVTFSGQISSGGTARLITKDGAGTVIFSGANKVYNSATRVTAGTLQVASGTGVTGAGNMTVESGAQLIVHGSLSGSGNLTINGGTVGGGGTISRIFTLDTGDVLSPGNGVGTMNTVNETWTSGGTLKLEINDSDSGAGSGWDRIAITGALSLTATPASKFKLELDSFTPLNAPGLVADFNPNTNYTWQFLTTTGVISGFNASAFQIDTSHFQNSLNGTFSVTLGADNKSLSVQYLAVPEPSSTFLALSGTLLFLQRRRRPKN